VHFRRHDSAGGLQPRLDTAHQEPGFLAIHHHRGATELTSLEPVYLPECSHSQSKVTENGRHQRTFFTKQRYQKVLCANVAVI
jgi:hypothetical protein